MEITNHNFHIEFAEHVRKVMFKERSSGMLIDEYISAYSAKIDEQEEIVRAVFFGEVCPTFKILRDMGLKTKHESFSEENPIKDKHLNRGFSCIDRIEFSRVLYVRDYNA